MYRPYARRLSRTKNVRVSDGDPSRNQSHPNEDDKPPGRWFLRSSSHLAILPLNRLRHYGRYIRSSSLGPSFCPYSRECVEGGFCELRLNGVLRRLMSKCERRGASRGSMLAPNLLPKAVPHDGPRLLPSLIVRLHRRVVEGLPPPERASQARPSGSAFRERGPYPGHPRPVASLQKRARLLAFRFFAPAPLLPRPVLPGSAQPAHPSSGAGVAPLAALLRRGSYGPFGSLPRDGHDPGAGHREGEGFAQRTVRRSGF